MKSNETITQLVKNKYAKIAMQENTDGGCCESACCTANVMNDDYNKLEGYIPEADLGLGCGLPTQFAKIKAGDTVLDLGSGAGNDCFVARQEVGDNGAVIGVDFTPQMITLARKNASTLGYTNVEFRQGDIVNMPVASGSVDVAVSNCVLNLVPDKKQVFAELYRVLKPGAHFSISDIVLEGELPEQVKHDAEMYAGCVAGAIRREQYLQQIRDAGFVNITVQKEKEIYLPDEVLLNAMNAEELLLYRNTSPGIYSITVYAERPTAPASCCKPACCN